MRKIFSLFAAILFAGSMMAAVGPVYYTFVPQKLSSGNVSDYTKSGDYTVDDMLWNVPGNWYAKGELRLGGKSITDVDRVITGKTAMGDAISQIVITHKGNTSDNLKLNSITVTTASDADFTENVVATTVTKDVDYTYAKNTEGTITITPSAGSWAKNAYYKLAFNITNTNGSNYAFVINKIEFFSYIAGGETPAKTKTIYCKSVQSWWTADGAAIGVYAWSGEGEGVVKNAEWPGVRMEAVKGQEGLWKADLDTAKYANLIFTRMNPSDEGNQDWGAKTANLTVPADKDLYTITSTSPVWGDPGVTGEWSVYSGEVTPVDPPTPVDSMTVYFVNTLDWANVNAYVWPAEGSPYKAWPGEAAKKEAEKINEKDVYAYTFPASFVNVIFNGGDKQTTDQNWVAAKPYFVPGEANEQGKIEGAWYAKEEIPTTPVVPVDPVENGFWKVTSETAVAANTVYVDNNLLKLNSVFAGTLKENARTIAGEEFTHAIQVRVDAWPTEAVKTGTEKSGSTPLVLVANEDIEITLYYNRQTTSSETGAAEENDNKDVWVFDHTAITTPITGEFTVVGTQEDKKYVNATKKLALIKGHTYTIAAKGTTLQLHGIKYGAPGPEPVKTLPVVALAGTMNGWSTEANLLVPAADSLTASVKVNLTAGKDTFKIVSDGKWLSLNGEGESLYGFHRDWNSASHINVVDGRNFLLEADITGDYIFTWTYADSTLTITFPEKPLPTLPNGYYLVGNKYDWTPNTERLFVLNEGSEGVEYQLVNITLAAEDSLKVVEVKDDAIKTWYPQGENVPNYVVDDNHAGVKTIYFRPNADGGDDWFYNTIYIAPNGTVGITNTEAEKKAVKTLQNGILVIEKNGKAYNVLGLQIR